MQQVAHNQKGGEAPFHIFGFKIILGHMCIEWIVK